MLRRLLATLLLTGPVFAHGGMFRPPPGGRGPGDPTTPRGGGGAPTTPGGGSAPARTPWEYWWRLNREPYLQFRKRIEERTTLTELRPGTDPFDRTALRETQLLPVMREALSDRDDEVRTSAAVALGKFRAEDSAWRLKEVFSRDKVRQVREAAMLGLLILRDPSLRDFFRSVARNEREPRRIRGFAVLALGFLHDESFLQQTLEGRRIPGSKAAVRELRTCAALAIGFTRSSGAVAPLTQVLRKATGVSALRGYAGCSLGRLRNPLAVPDLLDLLVRGEKDRVVRCGAGIGIGSLVRSDESGIIRILGERELRDRDPSLRPLIAMSLGRIGGEKAATYLTQGLSRSNAEERGFYCLALGICRVPDAGIVLQEEFSRLKNPNDRGACALGLALAGRSAAAPMILEELQRKNPLFAPHGMIALGILDDRRSIPTVRELVTKSPDPMIRREGAIALALLERSAAVPELVALLEKSKATIDRGALAQALGLVGNATAVKPLLKIYRDKRRSGEERAIALAALGRIGDPDRIPLLSRLAFDLNPYVDCDPVAEALTIL